MHSAFLVLAISFLQTERPSLLLVTSNWSYCLVYSTCYSCSFLFYGYCFNPSVSSTREGQGSNQAFSFPVSGGSLSLHLTPGVFPDHFVLSAEQECFGNATGIQRLYVNTSVTSTVERHTFLSLLGKIRHGLATGNSLNCYFLPIV